MYNGSTKSELGLGSNKAGFTLFTLYNFHVYFAEKYFKGQLEIVTNFTIHFFVTYNEPLLDDLCFIFRFRNTEDYVKQNTNEQFENTN